MNIWISLILLAKLQLKLRRSAEFLKQYIRLSIISPNLGLGELIMLQETQCCPYVLLYCAHLFLWFADYCIDLNPCPAEPAIPAFANSVDPDQLASEEADWSGSTLFAIKYVNL